LFGIAIFVAGGASNWVDRLPDGRVVDFLNVGVGPIRTGVFNVADMAIMAAAAILMLSEYFEIRKQRRGQRRAV
jgi:signal peptidase II